MVRGGYTVREVADLLGVTPQRIRTLAKRRNVGQKVSTPGHGGVRWVFSQRDLKKLKPGKPGYPKGRPRRRRQDTDTEPEAA